VRVVKVIEHVTNGIPSGTSFEHGCTGCRAQFTTESKGRRVMMLVIGLLPAALLVGLSFLLAWLPLLLVVVLGAPALLVLGRTGKRWLDDVRNPPLRPGALSASAR
jgi:hypothetical protein